MRAFLFFLQIAFLIGASVWIVQHPGGVTIEWADYRLHTSLAVLISILLALVIILVFIARIWGFLRSTPQKITSFWQKRQRTKGYRALTRGMVAVAAGDARAAQRYAEQASHVVEEQPLILLLAAQAAHMNGDEKGTQYYYETMLDNPETRFLGLRGLMIHAKRDGNLKKAQHYIHQAFDMNNTSPWILRSMFDINLQLKDFPRAHQALKSMHRFDVINSLQAKRYEALLCFYESMTLDPVLDRRTDLLKKAFKLTPDHPLLTIHLAKQFQDLNKTAKAQDVILSTWALAPHPLLAEFFLNTIPGDPNTQFKAAQRLESRNRDHEETLLLLANWAMNTQQWTLAHGYLDALTSRNPDLCIRACHLMARLYEEEQHNLRTARFWLQKATQATDAAWLCQNCAMASSLWDIFCPQCHTFDSFQWAKPDRVAASSHALLSHDIFEEHLAP